MLYLSGLIMILGCLSIPLLEDATVFIFCVVTGIALYKEEVDNDHKRKNGCHRRAQ